MDLVATATADGSGFRHRKWRKEMAMHSISPEPVHQAWAQQHEQERRLHDAQLAQITRHHDINPGGDAVQQQQAWARRQARQKHLRDSAMAQLRQS